MGFQDMQTELPEREQAAQVALPKAKDPCLQWDVPMPPELTASHTGPARNKLHHLCLYIDYASFSLMPPTPLQHRSQENLLILEAEDPALQSRRDKSPITYAPFGHFTETSQCKHT